MSRRHSQTNTNHGEPGQGTRFDYLSHKLAQQGNVTDSKALAAVIGREKFGAKRMANWAAKNRK